MKEVVLVADCGATNINVAALTESGELICAASRPNAPVPQPGGREDWLVWDPEGLWRRVCAGCREVVGQVSAGAVQAVAVTTWGADGAPVRADGSLTYPPIAWQCPRTTEVARGLSERIGPRRLFSITGYQVIRFNTLFKLAWLRQNHPEALDGADRWLMMPGLLSFLLTGNRSLDITSASTMMMLDLAERTWSEELLGAVGVTESFFPPLVYPGEKIGELTAEAARETGLREGTPVAAAGHDTQFAAVGSGAMPREAVLSTGTWEIAMLRAPAPVDGDRAFEGGVLTEADAARGLYNPQLLMMGSGALEWVRENFYPGLEDRQEAYRTMIGEARRVQPGAGGLMMAPSLVSDTGPSRRYGTEGTLLGLGLNTGRANVYRAALEGLCFQLRDALEILIEAIEFRPERLRVVGGGSRNPLWNQLRADVCGLPLAVSGRAEATAVGAAVAAWTGAGRFDSIRDGEKQLPAEAELVEPSEAADQYEKLYEHYRLVGPALADFYQGWDRTNWKAGAQKDES